ncbi:Phosphatidylinositol glycan anchor biosynthesis class U protein [Tetrabaena socialis]|uniref:Phosphatidylinositol glycan anchor biosynthesis class U protein n=1 Tax=Tetrabaena socialis TaxID=47790 RepID=A0A2J8AF96_9CHLO|nr:Phosphatidylinositol glycan anchor biosynthesis class U protein [Tetrabaena socialis]|eukprot:PNH11203.1 Phosphatidylinositol glycan anchor biosynthesis class U protein [Tetrabaena socialis]
MLLAALAGAAVRMALALSGLGEQLAWRVEVSTAANSAIELREGLALQRLGASPYTGSSCRTPPLALWLYGSSTAALPGGTAVLLPHALLNVLLDVLAAALLHRLAVLLMAPPPPPPPPPAPTPPATPTKAAKAVKSPAKSPAKASAKASAKAVAPSRPPAAATSAAAWCYLLNPLTVMAAAAGTTSSLEGLAVVTALYGSVVRRPALAALGLAAATYMSLHNVVLLVYIRLLAHSLLLALAPPLALRLGGRRPAALFAIALLSIALLKPYPSVADLGLAASLLPLLAPREASEAAGMSGPSAGLLMPASLLLLAVLGPAMLRMWLSYESANSNFYYSVSLSYGVWQVLLGARLLAAVLRSDRAARGKGRPA